MPRARKLKAEQAKAEREKTKALTTTATSTARQNVAKQVSAIVSREGHVESRDAKTLRAVIAAFCCPSEFPQQRVSTPYSDVPTALSLPFLRPDCPVGLTEDGCVEPRQSFAAIRKSLPCALIRYVPLPENKITEADFYFLDEDISPDALVTSYALTANQNVSLPIIAKKFLPSNVFSRVSPYDGSQYAMTVDGKQASPRFIWIDNGVVSVTINVTSGVGAQDVTMQAFLDYFDGDSVISAVDEATFQVTQPPLMNVIDTLKKPARPEESTITPKTHRPNPHRRLNLPGAVLTTTLTLYTAGSLSPPAVPRRGYFSVRVNVTVKNTATDILVYPAVTVSAATGSAAGESAVIHHPASGFEENAGAIEGYVISAASLMLSNLTPQLVRGGTIAGLQAPPGVSWCRVLDILEGANKDAYSELAKRAKSTVLVADTGMYSFMKPVDSASFTLRSDFATSDTGAVIDVWSQIVPVDPEVVMVLKSAAPVDGIPISQSFFWSIYDAVEYSTMDQWRESIVTDMDTVNWMEAVAHLRGSQQFCENPNHVGTTFKNIAQAMKTIDKGITGTLRSGAKYGDLTRKLIQTWASVLL